MKQEGIKIPKIGYEVYYPLFNTNLIKLNLTVCQDTKIDLSIPINITENLDKVNTSSGYYNDICYTFTSDEGTDISLADRKNDFIDNNLTVCEEGCDFTDFNSSIGKATCSCFANTNTSFKIGDLVIDKDKLLKQFTDFKNIANIKILKCYNLIFKKESFKTNCGNIIMISVMILFLIAFFIFIIKDHSQLKTIINVIVFLKLNQTVLTKFKSRKQNEKIKINKKSNNINKISSKSKSKSKKTNKVNEIKIRPQINIGKIDLNKRKERNKNNKPNPIKKNKKKQKNILNMNNSRKNNNNIYQPRINQIQQRRDISNKCIIIKYPDHLNEEQTYKLFLKINKNSDNELNDLNYSQAIKIDKRSYCEYYTSLIRTKHLLFYAFWNSFDYNSGIIKIYLFFFKFTTTLMVNALFFDDDTMHKIYIDKGDFNFIYNLPQIIYSAILIRIY